MQGWWITLLQIGHLILGLSSNSRVFQWKLEDVTNVTRIIESSFKLRVTVGSTGDCHSGSFNFIIWSCGTTTFLAGSWHKKGCRRGGTKEKGGLKSLFVPFLFWVAGAPCLFCFVLPLPLGQGGKFRGLIRTGSPNLLFSNTVFKTLLITHILFDWGRFCLMVELHREGSAPAACPADLL